MILRRPRHWRSLGVCNPDSRACCEGDSVPDTAMGTDQPDWRYCYLRMPVPGEARMAEFQTTSEISMDEYAAAVYRS